jgi:hypothetical protein
MSQAEERKDFKLNFLAATFPSGEIEEHIIIVTNAPDKVHVVGLFEGIMNADTSKLLDVQEVSESEDVSSIRKVNYPKNRG